MENVIEITGLSKKYKNFELSNVSIVIPNGCVAGFIGLNGHGKTTILTLLMKLIT